MKLEKKRLNKFKIRNNAKEAKNKFVPNDASKEKYREEIKKSWCKNQKS